jgi:hypothetical protein
MTILAIWARRPTVDAYPFPAIDIPIRSIKAWTNAHKQHVQRIRDIDDATIRAKSSRYFGNGRQNGGRGDWGQEAAERHDCYDDVLSPVREAIVYLVVVSGSNISDSGHVMMADSRDGALEVESALLVRNDRGILDLLLGFSDLSGC